MTEATPPKAKKQTSVMWLIAHEPPPKPLCFDSVPEWQSFLVSTVESGEKITRRSDTAKWATVDGKKIRTQRMVVPVFDRVDYCSSCAIGSQAQLAKRQAGRCVLPPLPYKTQIALFDATTDTLSVQRDRVADEAAKRKAAGRMEKAAAFLRLHGFEVKAPSVLAWIGLAGLFSGDGKS